MNIEEVKVYTFNFPLGNDFPPVTNVMLSIHGESKEDAAERVKRMLMKMYSDITMEYPSPKPSIKKESDKGV